MDLILIGNKSDLNQDRVVSTEEAKKFASDNNIKYFEISAHNINDINNLFNDAISDLFNKFNDDYNDLASTTLIVTDKDSELKIKLNTDYRNNKKSCCC